MVTITNNWLIVGRDDPSYFQLYMNLAYVEKEKRRKLSNGREVRVPAQTHRLYTIFDDCMYIPVGVFPLLDNYFKNSEVIYKTRNTLDFNNIIDNIDDYKNILDGITLRKEQLIALRKILYFKRCLIQMATGSGKSEILCAYVKVLSLVNGTNMTVLLMEPTIKLIDDIYRRFNKYNIPIVKYSDNRSIVKNCVNICHPLSLGNDLDRDHRLLEDVEVLLADETHHLASETFRTPTYSMNNLMYSIGVSASAISQDNVDCKDISRFSYNEALVIGATGPLVLNVSAKHLIESGSLAKPVLLMIDNPANESLNKNDIANWSKVSLVRLESEYRTQLVVDSAKFFHSIGRKSLILVRTKRWAESMLKLFYELGLSNYVRASFGGGVFIGYNGSEFFNDKDDVFKKYGSGEYTILIGTSHLYEGVDVPDLDTIILAYGGKGERLQIQGLGRVLRKTKTGIYAYIVDFTDDNDLVLSKHSRMRMKRYKELIGIPDEHIFYGISVSDIPEIFNSLEGNNK